jgi:hypothetical protein
LTFVSPWNQGGCFSEGSTRLVETAPRIAKMMTDTFGSVN